MPAGYTSDSPKPDVVLWRIVNTCIGLGIEMVVCATVFPVTAKQVRRLSRSLDQPCILTGM